MGFVSENKFEAIHPDIKPILTRYKRSENNPNYGSKLKDGMVAYNGPHM